MRQSLAMNPSLGREEPAKRANMHMVPVSVRVYVVRMRDLAHGMMMMRCYRGVVNRREPIKRSMVDGNSESTISFIDWLWL